MKKKVIIIGAGWSGIYALKHALEDGLDPILLEAKSHPLGIWHYSKLPGGVLRSTHATSSKGFMQPSDFPFPNETALFPHHDVIEKHLLDYIKKFELDEYIKYRHKVTKTFKQNNKWVVQCGEQKIKSDFLIISTGLNSVPNIPSEEMYEKFSGKAYHTHFFTKTLREDLKGKKVLIVGGGETACDIANILSNDCELFLSIRNGQWFQDRITGAYEAADIFYNRFFHNVWRMLPPIINIFKKEMEFWWGVGGTGVEIWKPKSAYFNGFYNKSRDIVQKIAQGEIYPRKAVRKIDDNKILFEDKKKWQEIDVILFGTGYSYKKGLSFVNKGIIDQPKYKHIFIADEPTIAFIGYVRPYLGSVPMLSEIQSRYVTKVFSGKCSLPNTKSIKKEIKKDTKKQKKMFPKNYLRMPFLVNPFLYSDEIANRIKAKPKMLNLLLSRPSLWKSLLIQSWSPFQYRIYDQNKHKKNLALKEIEKIDKEPMTIKLKRRMFFYFCIFIFILFTIFLSLYTIINL